MGTRTGLLAASLLMTASTVDVPHRLRCVIEGEAGCQDGECVGTGVKDTSLHLKLDAQKLSIALNGLTGVMQGSNPLGLDETRKIVWSYGLIHLTDLTLRKDGPKFFVATLASSKSEL